jgi:hypothetical protein
MIEILKKISYLRRKSAPEAIGRRCLAGNISEIPAIAAVKSATVK